MDQPPSFDETRAEHADLMRAVCDSLALMNVPSPVVPVPGSAPRFVKFGGYMVCTRCRMAQEYCACAKQSAPDAQSKDGSAESSLERRVRECMGGK